MNPILYEGIVSYLRNRASWDGISCHKWMGRWRVRWRDFSTTKQDMEFDSEDEAKAFARKIRYSDIEGEVREMSDEDAFLSAKFWIALDREHSYWR